MVKTTSSFMAVTRAARIFRYSTLCFTAMLWVFMSLYASEKIGEAISSEPSQIPSPVFLHASLGDRPLTTDTDAVRSFSHEFNTLEVEFAVPGYLDESQLEYGIRLRGLETEWHSSRVRESRYAALPPGSYVFEVRSRIGSGQWSLPASLEFEIQQPWWRTWPALAVWYLLIAATACVIFYRRMQKIRKRALQLENIVSSRTIELAMANADLARLSVTDPLTGLKNRRFVEFSITEDLARVRRSLQDNQGEWQNPMEEGAGISFLLVDLDHFKRVNDNYGHPAGDRVLRQISSVLASVARESDSIVRWGGEEFLIIARSRQGNDPSALAHRICKKVESTTFAVSDEQTIPLTCSVGFSTWPFFPGKPDALGWREVMALADRCLYLAKNSGRNTWIGVTIRQEYEGPADVESLNDFRSAEAKGIIRIQSSLPAGSSAKQYKVPSRKSSASQAYQ